MQLAETNRQGGMSLSAKIVMVASGKGGTGKSTLSVLLGSRLAAAGAVLMPFMPAFYTRPDSVDDLLRQFCGRLLDQFGLHSPVRRWRDEA